MEAARSTGIDLESPPAAGAREVIAGWFIARLLRLLATTWRVRVEDPVKLRAWMHGEPVLPAFWHNRLLAVPVIWSRLTPPTRPPGYALSSTSKDGELIAQVISRFGIVPIRGSASRRGSAALRAMVKVSKGGHDVGITPDGSRGPCYEIKAGLVLVAQLTGRPVLPVSFEFSSAWRLKSWDRFFIPKPFSVVTVVLGAPHYIPRTATAEQFEAARKACEAALMAPVRER